MRSFTLFVITIALLVFYSGCKEFRKEDDQQPYLIVLSLDGFRWDYPTKANTPTLDSLAKIGSRAESIVACFPTKTFPNHYSIATGLYPDKHGIVMNDFHAPDVGGKYGVKYRTTVQDGKYYGGTPIWNAAEKQGVKSASLFWVGSTADIQGMKPSISINYNEQLPQDTRIDSLVNWIRLPLNKRPHLIMWYYHEPDGLGHEYGPESEEIIGVIENLDQFLTRFFKKMRQLPQFDKLNFIITSDHGMAHISPNRNINIDEIVDTSLIEFVDGGNPIMNIKVKEGQLDKVYNQLIEGNYKYKAWKHGQLPEHLHYGNNVRTHDITIVADSSWSINWSEPSSEYSMFGTHGYENTNKDMNAIFYAAGPAFKENHIHPQFNNIDIYPLMGEILEIELPENDGKLENVIGLLKN